MEESEDFRIDIGKPRWKPIKRKVMPKPPRVVVWGHPTTEEPVIFISQEAYLTISEHIMSYMRQEVGGVLVGDVYLCPKSKLHYIIIEAAIPARLAKGGAAHVTFTHDTLAAIDVEMENSYPEKRILGWYHTHPSMGVFMSGQDIFTHTSFFPQRWQVALVLDPTDNTAAFFRRDGGKIIRCDGFLEILASDKKQSVVTWNTRESPDDRLRPAPADPRKSLVSTRRQVRSYKRYFLVVSAYAALMTIVVAILLVPSRGTHPAQAESIDKLTSPRAGACAIENPEEGCIWVFGGEGEEGTDNVVSKCDFERFPNEENKPVWECSANKSVKMEGSTAGAWYEDKLYCYSVKKAEAGISIVVWLSIDFNGWQQQEPLVPGISDFALAAWGNHMYVLGGGVGDEGDALRKVARGDVFDGSMEWAYKQELLRFERRGAAAAVWKEKEEDKAYIYAIGGMNGDGEPFTSVELGIIDVDSGEITRWKEVRSLRMARSNAAATVADGYLYVAGGIGKGDQVLGTIERARIGDDGALDDWKLLPHEIEPRYDMAAVYFDGHVYFIGGKNANDRCVDTVQRILVE